MSPSCWRMSLLLLLVILFDQQSLNFCILQIKQFFGSCRCLYLYSTQLICSRKSEYPIRASVSFVCSFEPDRKFPFVKDWIFELARNDGTVLTRTRRMWWEFFWRVTLKFRWKKREKGGKREKERKTRAYGRSLWRFSKVSRIYIVAIPGVYFIRDPKVGIFLSSRVSVRLDEKKFCLKIRWICNFYSPR